MPQLIGMTPCSEIVVSRNSAALRVGVVTARVISNVRLASSQASLRMKRVSVFGKMLWSTMLSAITWLVATIGMPRSRAIRVSPRPTMMCDWM
jgi:hypothetical protein